MKGYVFPTEYDTVRLTLACISDGKMTLECLAEGATFQVSDSKDGEMIWHTVGVGVPVQIPSLRGFWQRGDDTPPTPQLQALKNQLSRTIAQRNKVLVRDLEKQIARLK